MSPSSGKDSNSCSGCLIVVLLIIGGWFLFGRGSKLLESSPTPTRATAHRNQIAFASNRDGNIEIYVANRDGTGLTNLSKNPASDLLPVWSPDGTKIAFVSNRDGSDEIYLMHADGSNQTRLTNSPSTKTQLAWSPNGLYLAFGSFTGSNAPDIYVVKTDSGRITNLTNDSANDGFFTWSPDSKKLAFYSDRDSNAEIYVANIDGSGLSNLTNTPMQHEGVPAWSPDGKQIAFTLLQSGSATIYVMNSDGSARTQLTNRTGPLDDQDALEVRDDFPTWSPDGMQIAFISTVFQMNSLGSIYLINADGSGLKRLVGTISIDPRGINFPVWSPDGKQVAFPVFPHNEANLDIFLINTNGSGSTNLTSNSATETFVSWQP